jgi:hypothetical protein
MKILFSSILLIFFSFALINAQEINLIDIDMNFFDSIFDPQTENSTPSENETTPDENAEAASTVLDLLKRRGLTINASYEFQGLIAPGWNTSPLVFSWAPGIKMDTSITLDARISEVFRVISVLNFSIPGFFSLGDFFFDYNFFDMAFARAGKYEHSWGISPNYGFANLLSRVPAAGPSGPSYLAKADIPAGIGGLQMLALTRSNIAGGEIPGRDNVGFGGKYNLAFRWADFDAGFFYQKEMATRGALSIKTTMWDTELYNEWLLAINTHSNNSASFAFNFGFVRELYNNKIEVNGELFYNRERNTYFFSPETEIREAETSPFIEGFNMAFNALYRFDGWGSPRFYMQLLYAPAQGTARLVPGFRLSPISHIDIYLAVPMALGKKTGYYYLHTADVNNRPFSVMLYVTLKGSVQAGFYY